MSPKILPPDPPFLWALLDGIVDKEEAGIGVLDPLEVDPLLPLRVAYDTDEAGLNWSVSSKRGDCGLALLLAALLDRKDSGSEAWVLDGEAERDNGSSLAAVLKFGALSGSAQ